MKEETKLLRGREVGSPTTGGHGRRGRRRNAERLRYQRGEPGVTGGWHRRPKNGRTRLLELSLGRCLGFRAGIATTDDLVDWQSDPGHWGTQGCSLRRHVLDLKRQALVKVTRVGYGCARGPWMVVKVPYFENRWGGNSLKD